MPFSRRRTIHVNTDHKNIYTRQKKKFINLDTTLTLSNFDLDVLGKLWSVWNIK